MDSDPEEGHVLEIKPSDILGSLGTLIGLLFTALGLLANAKLDPGTFKIFANVIVVILLFFITAASLTAFGTATQRTQFWNLAKAIYSISWPVFGAGVFAMFLVIVYGPAVFTINIPQLNVNTDILTTLLSVFGGVSGAAISYYTYQVNKRELELDLASAQLSQEVAGEVAQEIALEHDVKMAFLRRAIELEELLRKIAGSKGILLDPRVSATKIAKQLNTKGVLSSDLLDRFIAIWNIRNKTVHGYEVPNSIARRSLEVTVDLLDKLKKVTEKKE